MNWVIVANIAGPCKATSCVPATSVHAFPCVCRR